MIKKKPLKASDPRSYENKDRADDSPGPSDLQSVNSMNAAQCLRLLPGSLGFHDPGGWQGGQEQISPQLPRSPMSVSSQSG